ncbi:hypothetical protein V1509DRAFT_617758 [Lipomyces kononenkoae]
MTGLQLSDLLAPQLPASQGSREDGDTTAVQGTEIQENLSMVGQDQGSASENMSSETVQAASEGEVQTASAESIKSTTEEDRLVAATQTSASPKPDVEMKHLSVPPSIPCQDATQLGSVDAISREHTAEGEEDETEDEPILPLPRKRVGEESNAQAPEVMSNTANAIESSTNTTGKSRESSAEPKRKLQKTNHTLTEDDGDLGIRNGTAVVDDDNKSVRGGAPTRRYLNELVTPALLDGVRFVAREQPENPLEVLGKYLLERSKIAKTKSKSSVKQKSSK